MTSTPCRNYLCRLFCALFAVVTALTINASEKLDNDTLRLLYWNIQNGMWSDQPNNYDNFVDWVKSYDPDVCVWCEAQTIYKDGTSEACDPADRYLTDNWGELAARYGHKYWTKSGHRDNYPQVITSKYPIEKILDIVGEEPDSVVTHGACQAAIEFNGKKINIVTLHTWPQAHAYRAKDIKDSRAKHEGDKYRRMEMEYICNHTILANPDAKHQYWMMMGDFNSLSPIDKDVYKITDDNDTRLITQDYILRNTPFNDIIGEKYPGEFHPTIDGDRRIDFIYCTWPMYTSVVKAYVVRDSYTKDPKYDEATHFHYPSDHRPILVDFELK